MIFSILLSVALGQEVPKPTDTTKVIGPLVSDQEVKVQGDDGAPDFTFKLSGKYWLLRDDAYRNAIANARSVPQLQEALEGCQQNAMACGTAASEAWATMKKQFDSDDSVLDHYMTEHAQAVSDLSVAKHDLELVKRQRTTAYVILGGVVAAVIVGVSTGLSVH